MITDSVTNQTVFAWHFVGDKLRDGRPIPADGEWLVHDGRIAICESGLHASRRPWQALRYAPGAVLCYVECRGDIYEQGDKLVCRERRILVRADVTETLRFFARMQALSVVHLRPECPPDVVLDYLMTGDESIRAAAEDVARTTAARAAAAAAAQWASAAIADAASAMAASMATARDAARDAARAAAIAAAEDVAARDAAWDAAMSAAGLEIDALIYEQFEGAA